MRKTVLGAALLLLAVLLSLQGCTTAGNNTATPIPNATQTAAETPAAAGEPAAPDVPAANTDEKTFTLDELLLYDGTNGMPAYIAVDGVVYDVTNVPQWKGGLHNGFTAGHDLTTEIKTISPHGVSKLTGIPVVGKLAN
jgi:predicted heme/steroid binding protein